MQVFYDGDADTSVLEGRTVAIIGYGNQGRAQGLNMRDSGVEVIVGNIEDDNLRRALSDGFPAMPIREAVHNADILCLLLPDELQREVFDLGIKPALRAGQVLNFAHGYNIRYGLIEPPQNVDIIMVAPRMIGVGVRERFLAGSGAPAFVAVEQDATGRAWPIAIAIARAIGATRVGALKSSFAEETELDLFSEQAIYPTIFSLLTTSFELLVARGYQPEAVLMELYASGEPSQVLKEMAEVGLFRQTAFHSRTSQYGTLSRYSGVLPAPFRETLARALDDIQSGAFAQEWEAERRAGYPVFNCLRTEAQSHVINEIERQLKEMLKQDQTRSDR